MIARYASYPVGMFDSVHSNPSLVFLHIPKTAGQSVHNALAKAFGEDAVSPIRVHTQAANGSSQFPKGYRLYSGHLDWMDLEHVPKPRFVFSILRDPRERIASFYFYLLNHAKTLSEEELQASHNVGKRVILKRSADDYFFHGNPDWLRFIEDHYDNFYCRYFGSRKIRAGADFSKLRPKRKLRLALQSLNDIDWVYSIDSLHDVEADLKSLFGYEIDLTTRHDNRGSQSLGPSRWDDLMGLLESDASRQKLERLVALDIEFMKHLEL